MLKFFRFPLQFKKQKIIQPKIKNTKMERQPKSKYTRKDCILYTESIRAM